MNAEKVGPDVSRRSLFEKTAASVATLLAGCVASPEMSTADTCSRKDCQPQVSPTTSVKFEVRACIFLWFDL